LTFELSPERRGMLSSTLEIYVINYDTFSDSRPNLDREKRTVSLAIRHVLPEA